jgi:hypothetical protein
MQLQNKTCILFVLVALKWARLILTAYRCGDDEKVGTRTDLGVEYLLRNFSLMHNATHKICDYFRPGLQRGYASTSKPATQDDGALS